ncbi:hypothetical protein EN852_026080 [Mesorhizobium sp. M2E.F.Ca.ET.209.01.1.1]|uniref:KAP family P-loop NTPase fold protein n=1 Tax=Mesorhizobium sp. M2E.F.Ca.ET.209.01.1.1 TaxID=2500526 RepID=UPI000FD733AA|nr:P-loop NTPase fold protein [Mesorhizobium sp. M2E.F.Ca.ET.209.01.1.1]TGS10608.1 hypothetical protein EN852_026080 [Mesorhizobium sp. M2E.F.Ca.ET.209.01.1.1]
MDTEDLSDTTIGSAISVRMMAAPEADVVFLPTDDAGTPGQLNSQILRRLGLPTRLPSATDLQRGYHVEQTVKGLICYVVTVTSRPAEEALEMNFAQAIVDPALSDALSIWVPLMGTGDGQIPFERSFSIILDVLGKDPRIVEGKMSATISVPEMPPGQLRILSDMIHAASGIAVPTKPMPINADPYQLARSDAVTGALEFATSLSQIHPEPGSVLSTTLLFFALAESQSTAAPFALRDDAAAEFFSVAVRFLAADRYSSAWRTYFGTDEQLSSLAAPTGLLMPTKNVTSVLQNASAIAGGADKLIQVDHLATALLNQEEARLRRVLAQMEITANMLLTEYRDARLGQVATKFNNDVATSKDHLGYDSYAKAICEFLTHAETPPPLSISIQAPWGGGKSSLMNLVREQLDPREVREEHRRPIVAGSVDAPRLLLGSVLRFLDREEGFSVNAQASAGQPMKRLWTIWFNAWKYDTTEQVWAGLVDAIVSQVAERLPLLEREKFLLKLQLARIDDGLIRKRIYNRIVTVWWAKVSAWVFAGASATLALFGLAAVKPDLPEVIQKAISLWQTGGNGYAGAIAAQIILSGYLVGSYFKSRNETHKEPATFSLAEYIRIPDYDKGVGEIHQIHSDLRRVLGVVPRQPGESDHAPIVIFIDDLDRCSPSKVASVVEGVSMLLASDTYRCMFVIGMDPQMVAAALEKAHEDVRKQLPRYERAVPLGWRFMDKFIQLPFTIPPTGGRGLDKYVNWLVGTEPPVATQAQSSNTLGPIENVELTPPAIQQIRSLSKSQPKLDSTVDGQAMAAVSAKFAESRDVGNIIRKIATYSVGNPREMKRMVNLARFYLSLRSARRVNDQGWRAPDLDQYARWIAVTLRWPDMLRWLQWGADEAHWPPEQEETDLIVRRLRALESHASRCDGADKWRAALKSELNIPVESDSDWACDPKLFEFFKAEAKLLGGKRLSDAAMRGFW